MIPAYVNRRVVIDRLATIDALLVDIRALPLDDETALRADRRNLWTIESCVRRSLEALLDVGRHILAKGFARGTSEYREIATALGECGVLTADEAQLMARMAGYRNRLVHLYHDVGDAELIDIAQHHLPDIEVLANAYRRWVAENPGHVTDL
jgi:uncharacterized protein YutE (UPF0331/DUF86 family)